MTDTFKDTLGIGRLEGELIGGATPSGPASGDLSGAYPGPTVAKVNGVAVTGTPNVGDVPTATGAAAASWAPPAAAPGSAVVRGPFSFAFNTPGINNGVTVYTPTVDDILLDAWIEVDTAFDGTTPKADVGTFVGTNFGLFSDALNIDLSKADEETLGTGTLIGTRTPISNVALGGDTGVVGRFAPLHFTAANPLLLVVSQNGQKGGTAIGGAAGAGRVYIVTATPVALP